MAPLRYFVFTASEDGFGQAAWEGLASLRAEDLDAAQSELRLLLSALEARAPGPRAPLEEGGAWDWQLDRTDEDDWIQLYLCVTGPVGWADDLFLDQ